MAEEITQKHLQRARVRGAPSTILGAGGLIGSYGCEEVSRQTVRALALELPAANDWDRGTLEQLREAQDKLSAAAASQGLTVLEAPLFALTSDPTEEVPHEWQWMLFLPVRGPARRDEATGIVTARIEGGMYLRTSTRRGFPDLRNLYTYFLGHFMPSRKQQLTRPLIYHRMIEGHRAIEGLDTGDPDDRNGARVTLEVFLPYQLSLDRPVRLVTREEM